MIEVTRFNDTTFLINADLIETVEETPDTVLTLTTGRKFVIKENAQTVRNRVIDYKHKSFLGIID